MAKRPPPGKCVHCLADPVARNWDHIFPKSWYPDTSATNLCKWQIPSCVPCNSALGAIEEDFLRRIALCLDPFDPASRSIVQKALRSMKPTEARNERDRNVRGALRQRILGETLEGDAIPQSGTFPGMGEKWGQPRDEQVAIRIPAASFRRITEKIVRGIFHVEDRKYIEPPYKIDFFALDSSDGGPVRAIIDRFGAAYAREPGIVVRRAVAPEDGLSSVFEIEFWQQFMTYATVRQ